MKLTRLNFSQFAYLIALHLCISLISCSEKWTSEQESNIVHMRSFYTSKLDLQATFIQTRFRENIVARGSREWDLKVYGELQAILETIEQADSVAISVFQIVPNERRYELEDMIWKSRESNPFISHELKKAYEVNLISHYYARMVGSFISFDQPVIRVWQSLNDPSQLKTGIGSQRDSHTSLLLKTKDGDYEIIDPVLNVRPVKLEWKLLFEKLVEWSYEED